MEVSAEAKRIMVVALGKLYSSRTQRGGLRLHRSLLLTLVMKSARDIYHEAQTTVETVSSGCDQQQHCTTDKPAEPAVAHQETLGHSALSVEQRRTSSRDEPVCPPSELPCDPCTHTGAGNKENLCPTGPAQHSRKRRGTAAAEPDFLPYKKAKLEQGASPHQLIVHTVLMDYVTCSSEMGAPPAPILLQRAVAVC